MPDPTEPWHVVNVTEQPWHAAPGWGRHVEVDHPDRRFADYGVNIHVLEPGEISTRYHGEGGQEGFLVLSGTPTLIVEGEERVLAPWDYFHCPAWTRHAFANAGDVPAVILMTGARDGEGRTPDCVYPVDPVAARHGTSVETETWDGAEAYAGTPETVKEPYRRGTLPGA